MVLHQQKGQIVHESRYLSDELLKKNYGISCQSGFVGYKMFTYFEKTSKRVKIKANLSSYGGIVIALIYLEKFIELHSNERPIEKFDICLTTTTLRRL